MREAQQTRGEALSVKGRTNNTVLIQLLNYILLYRQVEVRTSKELLLEPVTVTRSESERCYIESSINSVRISLRFKFEDADRIEQIIGKTVRIVSRWYISSSVQDQHSPRPMQLLRFLMKRAEDFIIMRRVPIEVRQFNFQTISTSCLALNAFPTIMKGILVLFSHYR